jgi:hypothetical protein
MSINMNYSTSRYLKGWDIRFDTFFSVRRCSDRGSLAFGEHCFVYQHSWVFDIHLKIIYKPQWYIQQSSDAIFNVRVHSCYKNINQSFFFFYFIVWSVRIVCPCTYNRKIMNLICISFLLIIGFFSGKLRLFLFYFSFFQFSYECTWMLCMWTTRRKWW